MVKNLRRVIGIYLIALTAFAACQAKAEAVEANVESVSAPQYFETALNEINQAKFSILCVMYLISSSPDQPESQPNQLLNALIKAKDRGVAVKVILDQNINFESESSEEAVAHNKNQEAFELLRKNNVSVFFDTSDTYTHSKVIVIDGETVIVGSTNWSKSALTRNNETNVLIRSKEFAAQVKADLDKIKLQENIPASLTPVVPIPKDFLLKKKLLGEMASQSDERAFDAYLYLLKEFDQNQEKKLTLDYDNLAKALKLDQMPIEDYRRQIRKTLEKLKEKYKLITFAPPKRNQNAEVTLTNLGDLNDSTKTVQIPTTFFRYSWNKTLSFSAKVMYLIDLLLTQESHSQSFSIGREKLSQTYGISKSFVSNGNQELRRQNLLEIKYGELENNRFSEREASTYILQDLYNPEDQKIKLKDLERKHGKEKLDHSKTIAQIVFEENNPRTIEALIDLENQFGPEILNTAAMKIQDKNPDNPKRSAGYLINTIKSMAKEPKPA